MDVLFGIFGVGGNWDRLSYPPHEGVFSAARPGHLEGEEFRCI